MTRVRSPPHWVPTPGRAGAGQLQLPQPGPRTVTGALGKDQGRAGAAVGGRIRPRAEGTPGYLVPVTA